MSGRRILVSGASRGLGRALVEHFVEAGDKVVGCARGESDFRHANYSHVEADISDAADVKTLFREVRSKLNGLDILINNAGIARMSPMILTPAETAAKIFDVNFMGTFQLSSAAIRLLRRSDNGRIVNNRNSDRWNRVVYDIIYDDDQVEEMNVVEKLVGTRDEMVVGGVEEDEEDGKAGEGGESGESGEGDARGVLSFSQ